MRLMVSYFFISVCQIQYQLLGYNNPLINTFTSILREGHIKSLTKIKIKKRTNHEIATKLRNRLIIIEMSEVSQCPQPTKNVQINTDTEQQACLLETVRQQEQLIQALREEVHRMQAQSMADQQARSHLEKLYAEALEQIQSQQDKIEALKENNESIMHTFKVFQREFVKRSYHNGITMPAVRERRPSNDGPLFLELIRNMKKKFSDSSETASEEDKPDISTYYGYFFHESLSDSQSELYHEVIENSSSNRVILGKIKLYGRKKFFNEKHRHYFWYNIIDKPLKMTYKLYQNYESKYKDNIQHQNRQKKSLIDRDLNRMDFKLEQDKTNTMKQEIKRCLQIFELYRPDIGYVQGMSYLAWMFLLRMQDYQGFSCFANLIIGDPFVHSLYTFKQDCIRKIVQFFEKCLEDKRPKLFKHMRNLEVDSELFIIEWAYTMFTRAFNLRTSSKIWDLWICDGYSAFFRVATTVLEMLEPQILGLNENDKIIDLLRTQTHQLDEAELLKNLRKNKLPWDLQL